MKKPESKKLVLDWIFKNGISWFKPAKAIKNINLNSSLTYNTLKTFHNKKILQKAHWTVGKQTRIEYKLDEKVIKNLIEEIIDSLEIMLDIVDPYV